VFRFRPARRSPLSSDHLLAASTLVSGPDRAPRVDLVSGAPDRREPSSPASTWPTARSDPSRANELAGVDLVSGATAARTELAYPSTWSAGYRRAGRPRNARASSPLTQITTADTLSGALPASASATSSCAICSGVPSPARTRRIDRAGV